MKPYLTALFIVWLDCICQVNDCMLMPPAAAIRDDWRRAHTVYWHWDRAAKWWKYLRIQHSWMQKLQIALPQINLFGYKWGGAVSTISSCALTNKFTTMEERHSLGWQLKAGQLLLKVKRTVKGSKSSTEQAACWVISFSSQQQSPKENAAFPTLGPTLFLPYFQQFFKKYFLRSKEPFWLCQYCKQL